VSEPVIDDAALDGLVLPGARIAVADGCGAPSPAFAALSDLARARGDLRLLLGWMPAPPEGLDLAAFTDVRTVMPGWGMRPAVDAGLAHAVPARLASVPGLVAGPLRPDLLLARLVEGPGGFLPGSEVSWLRAVVDAGTPVAAVVDDVLPRAAAGPALPDDQVFVLGRVAVGPAELPAARPTPEHTAIAGQVARLLTSGCRLQWGPGQLGSAVVDAVRVPVRADSGLLGDAVVDLDERGLLVGDPVATYLAGSRRLHAWADARGHAGHPVLHRIEHTHDPVRLLADPPLIAVNTAVEVDLDGQVNVEGGAHTVVGGIGGHPDYAAGASRSERGRSVVALASTHRGVPTLVERLSRPVSTPSHDVDVIVTEHGSADLRGLDRAERRRALRALWTDVRA